MFLFFTLFIFSCSEDIIEDTQLNTKNTQLELEISDSRLIFTSKEHFQIVQQGLQKDLKQNEQSVVDFFNSLYESDFVSLYPLVDEEDTNGYLDARVNGVLNNENLDPNAIELFSELEDAFGDETFSSLLNQNAEVAIGDQVFKYTDSGLFMIDIEDYNDLNTYLNQQSISDNLLARTDVPITNNFINDHNPCGGIVQLSPNLSFFAAATEEIISDPCVVSGGSFSSGSGSSSGTQPSADDHAIASMTLNECAGSSPLLGNIFGTTKVCHDQYSDRRRVKNKYYDIDVFLAYAIGVKVKHQFKGGLFGDWRKEEITEMGMGLNSITWKYTPQIYNVVGQVPTNLTTIYVDGQAYRSVQDWVNYNSLGPTPLPNLPFNQNDLDVIIEIADDVSFGNISTERDLTELVYSQIFDQVRSTFSSLQSEQLKKAGIIIKSNNDVWIQYYDLAKACNNCDKIEEVLDWGIMTPLITYNFGNADPSFSFDYNFDFRNPEAVKVSGYGMARSGTNQWHGNRVIFE
ncbi:hypothetical protein [Nonlabens sp.]|uniref:hypothetical protein n=1 Tax=Nonlabens sp. TaxID=1888209 RepID=UPI001BD08EF2|nr:hypothetical protein [Nonlabens sp.]